METKELIIEDVTYIFRKGNFKPTKKVGIPLVTLLKGVFNLTVDVKGKNFDFVGNVDPFAGIDLLDSPVMERAEKFIIDHLEVRVDGKAMLLRDDEEMVESHFRRYSNHYYTLVGEGIKFHFLDLLPAGLASLKNISVSKLIDNLTSKQTPTG